MFSRILVANRGEIALRILKTCRELEIETVLAASAADMDSLAARSFDRTVCIGPGRPADSYLKQESVLAVASALGCDAIHPGYGFLAENAAFAERCSEAGVAFIGPSPELIRLFGDKVLSRKAAADAGVPVILGSSALADHDEAHQASMVTGYPVMLKASRGGGGKGMRIVHHEDQLEESFGLAAAEAQSAFGDGTLYVERWIETARHVEVQIVADHHGTVMHLGDRDCSIQRRNQKLVEEAPAPSISRDVQQRLRSAAVDLCRSVGYDSVGTVEFLLDAGAENFFFLEVNPRIQVEHGVTEMVTGQDVVALQIAAAGGERLALDQSSVTISGHAIEVRVNAEDPSRRFQPSPGRVVDCHFPQDTNVRVDTHCFPEYFVPPYYDSLLAKVMTFGRDRTEAIARMGGALSETTIDGVRTTLDLVRWAVQSSDFESVHVSTRWLDERLVDESWVQGEGAE